MTPGLRAACGRSIHVVLPDGRTLRAGRASLYVLEQVGWGAIARLLARPPLVWAVEAGYRLVAARRDLAGRFLFRPPASARDDRRHR